MNNRERIFPNIRLRYKKRELIFKEGDYGVSIYKIVRGKVEVFTQSGGREIPLGTLDRGKVLGEMIFLKKTATRRSASARTLEDSELEVWHPTRLSKEFEQMPPILKCIADQALNRLIRMNTLVAELDAKRQQEKDKVTQKEPRASKRLDF